MKVLFWVSPITEMSWPFQKIWWLRDFLPRTLEQLRKVEKVDAVVTCVSEDLYQHANAIGVNLEGCVLTFSQRELTDSFSINVLDARRAFQREGKESRYYVVLDQLCREKIDASFLPDVIVSFNESPFLRKRYPSAVHLTLELSVFSRPPYPTLFAFDPISDGNGCRFTTSAYSAQINAIPADKRDLQALSVYRGRVLSALHANAEIENYFASIRSEYDHILLVPLGYEQYFDTLVHSSYPGQFEFVEHVLSSVDEKTCIILTQHPTIHAIRPERIGELKSLWPNLRYENWFGSVPCFSQVALAYCDGCVVGGSSLAYQAAFLGKYLISPDRFCEGLADIVDLSALPQMYATPPKCRDNYMVWVLRHLAVEMDRAGEYLQKALPIFRTWNGHSAAVCLTQWPEVLDGSGFLAALERWTETFSCYSTQLSACELKPMENDLSMQNYVMQVRIDELNRNLAETTTKCDALAAECDARKADRDAIAADRDAIATDRDAIAADRDAIVADRNRMLNSTCWRMTEPIRFVLDNLKARTYGKLIRGTIKQFVPYGIVVWWLKRHYSQCIDMTLFYYPGFGKRLRRLVKFVLPYCVTRRLKRPLPYSLLTKVEK